MSNPILFLPVGISAPALVLGSVAIGLCVSNSNEINQIKQGGNIKGPVTSTLDAIAIYGSTDGTVLLNSQIRIQNQNILTSSNATSIDMSNQHVLNLIGGVVEANGLPLVVSESASITNGNIALFATNKSIQSSNIRIVNDSIVLGATVIDMSTPNVLNFISTSVQVNSFSIVTSAASSVAPGTIALFSTDNSIDTCDVSILNGSILSSSNNTSIDMSNNNILDLIGSSVLVNHSPIVNQSALNNYLLKTGDSMSGILDMTNHSVINASNLIITSSFSSVDGNIPVYSGSSGLLIVDSGQNLQNFVTNGSPSVANNIATFANTTGNQIQDSNVSINSIPTPTINTLSQWVPIHPFSFGATTSPFSLFNNPATFSTLVFPANSTQEGTTLLITGSLNITTGPTTTFTVTVTKNGTNNIISGTFAPGTTLSSQPFNIEVRIQTSTAIAVNTFAYASLRLEQSGQPAQFFVDGSCVWDFGVDNTIDMTGTFSDTSGSLNIFVMAVNAMSRVS